LEQCAQEDKSRPYGYNCSRQLRPLSDRHTLLKAWETNFPLACSARSTISPSPPSPRSSSGRSAPIREERSCAAHRGTWGDRVVAVAMLMRRHRRLSFLLGQSGRLREADYEDLAADIQEGWVDEYGSVFVRPGPLGTQDIVVTDPKAFAYIHAAMEVRACAADPLRLCTDVVAIRPPTRTHRSARASSPRW
jgi:hypothetical protein